MILRFLRKYWGCFPLILSLMLLLGVYLLHRNTELHLRYLPSFILVWLLAFAWMAFALWGVLALRRWLRGKGIYYETVYVAFMVALAALLSVAGWLITRFWLQPERTTVKYEIPMVACTQGFLDKYVCYYEYLDGFFYGKQLGSEYYGDYIDGTSDPLEWEFYDRDGNLLDSGLYQKEEKDEAYSDDTAELPSSDARDILNQSAEPRVLEIEVMENREDELVFSVSIEEYIESYNGYYWQENEARYLLPSKDWQCWLLDTAIHCAHETKCYQFSEDERAWTLPTITVYTPTNGDYIQEITLNFDWHSFTESMYLLYEQMCYYTLQVFFPELSEEQIVALYSEANNLGYENVFPSDARYSSDSVPTDVFYKDGIGVYSYFAIGSSQRLCIIPVTEETIEEFQKKGVVIHKIP